MFDITKRQNNDKISWKSVENETWQDFVYIFTRNLAVAAIFNKEIDNLQCPFVCLRFFVELASQRNVED